MNAATLQATLEGSGDAVAVLLHGLTGSSASATRYAPVGLAHLFVDLPSHGASPDVGDFSPDDVTRRVAAVIAERTADFAQVHLIGVSLGAAVVRRLAVEDKIAAATATFIRPAHTAQPHPPHLALNVEIARLLDEDPRTARDRLRANDAFVLLQAESPAAAANLLAKTRVPSVDARGADAGELRRRARLLRAGDLWTSGPITGIPALVIAARDDALHPEEVARAWARELPQARLETVPSPSDPDHAATVRALTAAHIFEGCHR